MKTGYTVDEYHKQFGARRTATINGSASDFSNIPISTLVTVITEVNGLTMKYEGNKIGTESRNLEEMEIGGVTFSIADITLYDEKAITCWELLECIMKAILPPPFGGPFMGKLVHLVSNTAMYA
jgi:hypothetical protein